MNGNRKEASDRCGTGIFVTWISEEEGVQSRQGHGELGDVVIVQFEYTRAVVDFAVAADHYVQMGKVSKCSDYGGEGNIDDGIGEVSDVQGF